MLYGIPNLIKGNLPNSQILKWTIKHIMDFKEIDQFSVLV